MADTLSEGIVVPAGGDQISAIGVAEMRTLGATTNSAVRGRATVTDLAAARSQIKTSRAEVDLSIEAVRTDFDTRLDGIVSAYELWLEQGNTGTVEDYFAAQKGDQGDTGPYGGTEVTDPQVASYIGRAASTETAAALDRSYRRGVSVAEYGAVGDGVTDDSVAFQAALDSGLPVYVPEGVWLVSGVVTDRTVDLELARGAVIEHQSTGACITVAGTEATTGVRVGADVPTGATTVTAPGHTLVAGDWVRLASEDVWDAFSTGIRQGELLRVAEISGDLVTFATAAQGQYTLAGIASLWRLDLVPKVTVRGSGTFRGARTPDLRQTGLMVRLARNVRLEGVDFDGFDYRHFAFPDATDVQVAGVDFEWAQDSGQAYAVAAMNAAQDFSITGCTFVDVRHCFTTSNEAAVRGIARRGVVSNCTSRRTLPALGGSMGGGDAFDTHTASDDITFEGLMIVAPTGGGINMEGRTGRIRFCTVIDPGNRGIDFHNESDHDGLVEVVGNLVVRPGTYGVRVAPPTRGAVSTIEGVIVSGNTVVEAGSTPIYIGTTGGSTLYGVSIHNNFGLRNTNAYLVRAHNVARVRHSGNNSVGSSRDIQVTDLDPDVITVDPGFRVDAISSGAATVTPETRYLRLGATTTGTLSRIDGGVQGQIIIVRLSSSGSSATLVSGGAGNLKLASALTLSGTDDTVTLGYTGTTWLEVSRTKF